MEPRSPKGIDAIRLREWATTVLCWDGVFPLGVAAVASIATMLPLRGLIEIFAILVPVLVLLLRQRIGKRHFQQQRHYIWQRVIFYAAIVLLTLLDCFFILFRSLKNAISWDDWIMWGVLYAGYFSMMAVAMFPFRVCMLGSRSKTRSIE